MCWTSGWSMTWTLARAWRLPRSEDGAVAARSRAAARRRAARARARGPRPRCRLRACTRAAGRATPSSARTRGASSSSSATVSARHSTTSSLPTSCGAPRRPASRRREHAGVEQQAAVAVLGQAGERVEAGRRATPAHSSGSNSEYASHCDSLWNGTQPAVGPSPPACGWRQVSPSGTPSSALPGPDRPEARRAARAGSSARGDASPRCQRVEQAPDAQRAERGASAQRRAEPPQQRRAALEPDQRIVAVDLEDARERRGVDRRERRRRRRAADRGRARERARA